MLSNNFDIKDLGEADVILGMKIFKNSNSVLLSQSHYTKSIIEKIGFSDVSLVNTPYDLNTHLYKNNSDPIEQEKYA
jgi:hypothetical protein